jgi:hypothetical protein
VPFVKGNTIGADMRFKTGQSGNPAGRPPDRLRKRIEAELEKIASSEPGEARTKLELLAENIVSDALRDERSQASFSSSAPSRGKKKRPRGQCSAARQPVVEAPGGHVLGLRRCHDALSRNYIL